MATLQWNRPIQQKALYFSDIQVNESFKITSPHSHGAVYRKVEDRHGKGFSMEEATGKIYDPTPSPIERVDVEVHICRPKPQIKGY